MPLMPKRVKFRKSHRGNRGGNASRGTEVSFGDFGLQTLHLGKRHATIPATRQADHADQPALFPTAERLFVYAQTVSRLFQREVVCRCLKHNRPPLIAKDLSTF
jgi:hypothetical protein